MKHVLSTLCLSAVCLWADGHGPALGFSTATLGEGDASVGTAVMWRSGVTMIGPVMSYGITENYQLSISAPFHLDHGEHPVGRFTGMMPGDPEVEVLNAWRFHHHSSGVGTRNEGTLYFGGSISTQTPPRADGPPLHRNTGLYVGAAGGHVSRKFYAWAGAGYERHFAWSQDHQSDALLSSFVLGWRPPLLDQEYPKPDLRFFWETTAEWVGKASRFVASPITDTGVHSHEEVISVPQPAGTGLIVLPNSGEESMYSGPTVLFTYKNVALQGGVLFALWRDVNGVQPADRLRAVASCTYYFLGGRNK
jgi:hypothetical protein